MPNINLDDAYILGETGAQVDKVTGLFTKDEDTTSGEKAFAQLNIGTAGSNRNLLDNAYFVGGGSQLGDGIFPINQRGQTSYGNGQTFDRWKLSAGGTVTLTQSGITFNGLLFQKKALDLVVGETYTLSRQTQNGEVVSLTGVVPSTEGWMIGRDSFGVYFRPSTKVCDIQVWGDYSLRAMKLEKGTVSTLANDVPPDYGTELIKCRGYFERIHSLGSSEIVGMGMGVSASSVRIGIPSLICHTIQSVTYSGGGLLLEGGGNYRTLTSIGKLNATPKNGFLTVTCGSSDAITLYQTYALVGTAAGGYIDISADL